MARDSGLWLDFHGPGGAAAFEIRGFDRIREPLAQVRRLPSCTRSTTTCSIWPVGQRRRVHVVERDGAAVDEQPAEALALQRRRVAAATAAPSRTTVNHSNLCEPSSSAVARSARALRRPFRPCVRRGRAVAHDRQVEADQQARARRQARRVAPRRPRPSRAPPRGRSCGRTCGRPARTAAACSRGSPSSCRRSTADCGCCSSAGSRSPARCRRCDRRPASPSARGTAARTRTATRRSGAVLRRRSCRRRATTCPIR